MDDVDVRTSTITGRRYENALIVGPAMLAPLDRVTFRDSTFDGSWDAVFFPVADGRFVRGVIGLIDVEFRGCRLENIGIIATPEAIERLMPDFPPEDQTARSGQKAGEDPPQAAQETG